MKLTCTTSFNGQGLPEVARPAFQNAVRTPEMVSCGCSRQTPGNAGESLANGHSDDLAADGGQSFDVGGRS